MMTPKGWYSIEQAAQELNVSVSEIENLIRVGKMREQVLGSRRLIPPFSVQAVLKSRKDTASNASHDARVGHELPENSGDKRSYEEYREKVEGSKYSQRSKVPSQALSKNTRDYYCPIDEAAKRLKKSTGQIRQLILEEELNSAVFGGERMVLVRDVERVSQGSPLNESRKKGFGLQSEVQSQKKMQQSRSPMHSELNKDHYCTLTKAAQRLNKSINQIKGLIETGKLRSELFGAQRMVLIQDLERLEQTSSEYCTIKAAARILGKSTYQVRKMISERELRSQMFGAERMVLRKDIDLISRNVQTNAGENESVSSQTVEYSKWTTSNARSEYEHDEAIEAVPRVKELAEELESTQKQLASERGLWKSRLEQERKERQQINSETQERIGELRKEAYAIQEELEQERSKHKKLDEDAQTELDTLDNEVRVLKEELEQERASRLGAQWEVQELRVELEDARTENNPLKSFWGRFKSAEDRINTGSGDESTHTSASQAEEQLEVLQSELEEEKQRREENEDWVKDLQAERDSLKSELEKAQAQKESLEKSFQATKAEYEEYVQKLLTNKEQAIAQAREQARQFEDEKNLLDEIRQILGSQSASESDWTTDTFKGASNQETNVEPEGYFLDTTEGHRRFVPPFELEDGDLELLQMVARHGELSADQIRRQTGRRRSVGDLDDLLDDLEEHGVSVIEVSEDRYRFDITKLQSD